MAKKVARRRIVVDASVISAAGGARATDPGSVSCRDCLIAIYEVCHSAAVSDDLYEEWRRHRSRFASRWFSRMKSKRKLVRLGRPDTEAGGSIRERLKKKKPTVLKDVPLLESALLTDRVVISRDDEAMDAVAEHCVDISDVSEIVWVNPATDSDVAQWLADGAPTRRGWTIGDRSQNTA